MFGLRDILKDNPLALFPDHDRMKLTNPLKKGTQQRVVMTFYFEQSHNKQPNMKHIL